MTLHFRCLAFLVFCWLQQSLGANCPTGFINLALHKPARQSSGTNNCTCTAAKAVDGNIKRPLTIANGKNAWWEVDLGLPEEIATIRAFSPDKRPRNYYQFRLFADNARTAALTSPSFRFQSGPSYDYQVPSGVRARYVRLEASRFNLRLYEVQVFIRTLNVTPTNLRCSTWSRRTDKIVCTWQQPSSCSVLLNYTVLLVNSSNQHVINKTVNSTHYTFNFVTSVLDENSNYTIQVRARTAAYIGVGPPAVQTITSPGSASSPTSLTCLSESPFSIRLGWMTPFYQHPDLPVTGYSMTFNNTHFHAILPETTLLETDVDGLSPNTTYLFGVSALNGYGSSESTHIRCTTAVVECQLAPVSSSSSPTSVATTQSLSTNFTLFPSQEIPGGRGTALTWSVTSHYDVATPSSMVNTRAASVEDKQHVFKMTVTISLGVVTVLCVLLFVVLILVSRRRNKAQVTTGNLKSEVCTSRNSVTEPRYAESLRPRPGSAGGTLESVNTYFNVDVEGECCRVALENFTCNQVYGGVAGGIPAALPRRNSVYEEVDNVRCSDVVDSFGMMHNVCYAETKL